MEFLVSLGLLLLIFLAAVAPGLYVLHSRTSAPAEKLELWQALQRRGLGAADAAQDPVALGAALRRCTYCRSVETCDEWLASGRREGLERFCPNAAYVQQMERS